MFNRQNYFFDKEDNIIYDLECYKNVFLFGALHIKTKQVKIFETSSRKDESNEMLAFLANNTDYWVGFNNDKYDYPLFHHYVNNVHLKRGSNTDLKNNDLFFKSKHLINSNNRFTSINTFLNVKPQIDLFKIHHYDNKNKRTSLKYLEFTLGLNNIEELPFDPETALEDHEIDILIEYLHNDLAATLLVYEKSLPNIKLREDLYRKFDLRCYNFSDSKIGEELVLKFYLEETGFDEKIVRQQRTYRDIIDFEKVIHPKICFDSPELKTFLEWWKSKCPSTTRGFFKEIPFKELKGIDGLYNVRVKKGAQYNLNIVHKDFQFDFGTGGIHGVLKQSKFRQEDYPNHVLMSCDVTSLYPSSIIEYLLACAHLDRDAFISVYRDKLYVPRVSEKAKPKDERDLSIVDGFKLSLNSVFGKMNSEYSWLYDPLQFMKTTVNNQLFMVALSEKLMSIEGSKLFMINTDGLEILIPKDKLDQYYDICSRWEKWSLFNLEHDQYESLHIRDVNNYSGKFTNGKIKNKGAYIYEKDVSNMHTDHSNLFASWAVNQILYDKRELLDLIQEGLETRIKMFINGTKIKRSDSLHFVTNNQFESTKDIELEHLNDNNKIQRVNRYICVNDDCPGSGFLIKKMPPLPKKPGIWRTSSVESKTKVILVNNLEKTDWNFIRKHVNLTWYEKSIMDLLIEE